MVIYRYLVGKYDSRGNSLEGIPFIILHSTPSKSEAHAVRVSLDRAAGNSRHEVKEKGDFASFTTLAHCS